LKNASIFAINLLDCRDTSQSHTVLQAMKMPADAIREEIRKSGAISFARFMELALYCPETGYYERKSDIVGQRGDFITSVSAGSLFGELLAFQFADWLGKFLIVGRQLPIVEAGAHDGQLARDILAWLRVNRPNLFERIEYVIVEPSPRRREWQQETLKQFSEKIEWLSQLSELNNRQSPSPNRQFVDGIIFSNELLDALPCHRLGWDAKEKKWFEWGVAWEGEHFCWRKMRWETFKFQDSTPNIPPAISGRRSFCPPELEAILPDNYTIEICPAAENWWRAAAGILGRGKLLTIDYGLTADELFSPARPHGTVRAYHRHHAAADVLAHAGEQDLTAHVDWSAIQTAGEEAGLRTEQLCTQPQFLTRILQRAVAEKSFAQFTAKQVRQLQTLTHPEHLGRAFRVLVQSR
jgi:SAM-dependent MidA family methyltransferase